MPLATAPTAKPGPDAALIAACAAFDALERKAAALSDDEEQAADAISEQMTPLFYTICDTRATTLAGMRARAATLNLLAPDVISGGDGADALIAAMLRDLIEA